VVLRNGDWNPADLNQQWPQLEAYMGLFEHCMVMLAKGLIDWETFQRIYEYRLRNIIVVPEIVGEKLILRGRGWEDFIQLVMSNHLQLKQDLRSTATRWLTDCQGKWQESEQFQWLNSDPGKKWLQTQAGNLWMEMTGYS
jgi:hypothetical protein